MKRLITILCAAAILWSCEMISPPLPTLPVRMLSSISIDSVRYLDLRYDNHRKPYRVNQYDASGAVSSYVNYTNAYPPAGGEGSIRELIKYNASNVPIMKMRFKTDEDGRPLGAVVYSCLIYRWRITCGSYSAWRISGASSTTREMWPVR